MSYKIIPVPKFTKELKKLIKKYPSLKIEISELSKQLHKKPKTGTALGNDCYKIRISIASKGVGKSGGGRIITHIKVSVETIYLLSLSIYDKSKLETISNKELKGRLKKEGLL